MSSSAITTPVIVGNNHWETAAIAGERLFGGKPDKSGSRSIAAVCRPAAALVGSFCGFYWVNPRLWPLLIPRHIGIDITDPTWLSSRRETATAFEATKG
jgi:hypothetical protein